MWFRAETVGVFQGQCAEFCGEFHADMLFQVVAESEQDFQAFIDGLVEEANARIALRDAENASAQD
jgi:cytochrome c oxidase subunit 2